MTQPTQLDRLQLAWRKLQDAVNLTIPNQWRRLAALRSRLRNDDSRGQ